jgi:hypothetical protein
MKHLVFLIALIGGLSVWAQLQDKKPASQQITIEHTSADETYIPRDLEDCIREIDKAWQPASKTAALTLAENDFRLAEQSTFGTWMRANWGLEKGERLAAYFHALGIDHPDDMTSIILTSYHRHLSKRPLGLEYLVREHKDHRNTAEVTKQQ